jgi:hypothetical protein
MTSEVSPGMSARAWTKRLLPRNFAVSALAKRPVMSADVAPLTT